MKRLGIVLLSVGLIAALVAAYAHFRGGMDQSRRSGLVRQWILNPSAHTEWAIHAGTRCGNAPFLLPTDGFIDYLWGDTFQANHPLSLLWLKLQVCHLHTRQMPCFGLSWSSSRHVGMR